MSFCLSSAKIIPHFLSQQLEIVISEPQAIHGRPDLTGHRTRSSHRSISNYAVMAESLRSERIMEFQSRKLSNRLSIRRPAHKGQARTSSASVFKMGLWYQTACKTVDHRDGLFYDFPMSALVGTDTPQTLRVLEMCDVLLDGASWDLKSRDHLGKGDPWETYQSSHAANNGHRDSSPLPPTGRHSPAHAFWGIYEHLSHLVEGSSRFIRARWRCNVAKQHPSSQR